jgi:hypothetical protein
MNNREYILMSFSTTSNWIAAILLVLILTGCDPNSELNSGVDDNPNAPMISLTATSNSIPYEGTVTPHWTSNDVFDCNAQGDWSGSKNTTGDENINNLTSDKVYTLTCSGMRGTTSSTVNVTVSDPAPGTSVLIF